MFLTSELRRNDCFRIKNMSPFPVPVKLFSCVELQGWRLSSITVTEFSLLNLIPFLFFSCWKVHFNGSSSSCMGILLRIPDSSHSSQPAPLVWFP